MQWSIGGQYVLKNNLMAMDLIANNNWERDIYYAVTTGPDTYINLDPYFELTGMAYRLTPMYHEKSPNPNKLGGVDTDVMYDNVMNKFRWGNMDSENIYMDENNIRMTTNIRLQLSNLAEELIAEGKNDLAKDILDKAFEVMPERTVPFSRVILPMIESYAKIGDEESAQRLGLRLFEIIEEEQIYFTNLDPRFMKSIREDMQIHDYVAKRIHQMSKVYDMKELTKEIEPRLTTLDASFKAADQAIRNAGRRSGGRGDF
jgi:uncharacterized secreted protein with C-terminal beta-propeller domain